MTGYCSVRIQWTKRLQQIGTLGALALAVPLPLADAHFMIYSHFTLSA